MLASAWRLEPRQEGEAAARILLTLLAGGEAPPVTRIEYQWIDRGSTSPPVTADAVPAGFAA